MDARLWPVGSTTLWQRCLLLDVSLDFIFIQELFEIATAVLSPSILKCDSIYVSQWLRMKCEYTSQQNEKNNEILDFGHCLDCHHSSSLTRVRRMAVFKSDCGSIPASDLWTILGGTIAPSKRWCQTSRHCIRAGTGSCPRERSYAKFCTSLPSSGVCSLYV